MNERIKELRDQSMVCEDGINWILDENMFAQLIVLECIDIVDETSGSNKLLRQEPYKQIVDSIEEHFGVE